MSYIIVTCVKIGINVSYNFTCCKICGSDETSLLICFEHSLNQHRIVKMNVSDVERACR